MEKAKKIVRIIILSIFGLCIAGYLCILAFIPLVNNGLQEPIGSWKAKAAIEKYLDSRYPDQQFKSSWPLKSIKSNKFTAKIVHSGKETNFYVSYNPKTGTFNEEGNILEITEEQVTQNADWAGSGDWKPQPEYENRDDYLEALDTAQKSVKTEEEIVVDDQGSNEKTALAWMEAWFDMYKALPKDNMAHIAQGEVDSLEMSQVSKEELPKAFIFSVTFSVRPTYPIVSNGFWMPGNTGNSPGRDDTWGQMGREVELRQGDDGRYHFVSMGTGGAGNPDIYDMVDNAGKTDGIRGLFSYSVSDIEKIEFQNGNTGELVSYTNETETNNIIEHLNTFRYDRIEPVERSGWTYAIRLWFKDDSGMQRITLTPSSASIEGNHYISSDQEYFPQEWLEKYWPS